MPRRTMDLTRRAVGGLALAGLSGLAGCSLLEGATTFEADPAGVPGDVQSQTEYQQEDRRRPTVERTFAGETVEVTNVVTEFQKSVSVGIFDDQKLGVFVAFSTPKVTVAGQGPFNPVSDMSNKELVQRLQSRYESIEDVQKVGSSEIEVLGSAITFDKFSAQTTMDGETLDLYIQIGQTGHEDDFVIPMGVYPQEVQEEESNITTLAEAVVHPD